MMDFIRDGGWPMFPTLGLGISTLIMSVRYAARPEPGQLALVRMLALLTLVVGLFGTLLGVQISANAIRSVAPDQRWIFVIGIAESLNCLLAALALLAPTVIAAGIGNYHDAREKAAQ